MEQVIERTAIPLHDGRAAINQLLHSIPLFPADNRLVTVLNNFPLIAGNEIYRIGTNCLLMAFTNYMVAFINRVAEHFANYRTTPRIIANLRFNRHLDTGDRDFAFQQMLGNLHRSTPIQSKIKNQLDRGRGFRVDNQVSVIIRVAHKTVGGGAS